MVPKITVDLNFYGAFMRLLILLLLWTNVTQAASVISDPVSDALGVTHCGLLLDTAAKVDIPAAKNTSGTFCKFDLTNWARGPHTVQATFVIVYPDGQRAESALSAPFDFVKQDSFINAIPTGWKIIP